MGYYEFEIHAAPETSETIVQLLTDQAACLGVFERQGKTVVYFADTRGITTVRNGIASAIDSVRHAGLPAEVQVSYTYLSERDWNESWKKKFQPIDVGKTLTIIPPWESAPNGRIAIIVDPGMAFGTGHHETTRFCLATIEQLARHAGHGRFGDIGTGTGILAIAARKLGFAEAVGVDIDPLAIDAARRNVTHNQLDNIDIYEGSVETLTGQFDLVAANLLSEILKNLAPEIVSRMKPGGLALLSGIMTGQEDEVIEMFSPLGVTVVERLVDGRWVSLVIRR